MLALGFEVLMGSLTITGSLMAFSKLQGILPSAPFTYRFQNFVTIGLFAVAVGLFLFIIVAPAAALSSLA